MSLSGRRSTASIGARRKTTEACDPCRARKLKCDGLLPCKSCEKSKAECLYDSSTAANKITGFVCPNEIITWSDPDGRTRGLDIINARVVELERAVFGERTMQPRNTASISDSGQILDQNLPGVTIYSEDNGSLSFYGITSTLNLLIPVERLLNDPQCDSEPPNKRQKRPGRESELTSALLNEGLQDQIYATESIHKLRGLQIRERIADAHFDCFLESVNDAIPVLAPSTLRAAYELFWSSSPSELETSTSRQRQCLIYSVLALGSLYSNTESDDFEWASYYFAEAQSLIGTLFNTNSLSTVQAAMMMAIYAHHISQPNLAYNYLGTAIRMAYSIGINGSPNNMMAEVIDPQSALRTWWTLYSLESDICLEYGKPLCIRETDAKAPYPQHNSDVGSEINRFNFIVANAKFSRIVRKIIDLISNMSEKRHPLESFVGRMMNHQAELMTWRGELPSHLAPKYAATSSTDERAWSNISWVQRQCFDIELRFNHVMLVLHRPFFADITFSTPFYSSLMARSVCLGAARETILLSNKVFVDGPGVQHWSCYNHRVLAATLLTLECCLESPLEERNSFMDICTRSLEIFKSMPAGCSRKGIALVEGALAQIRDQALRSKIDLRGSANVT